MAITQKQIDELVALTKPALEKEVHDRITSEVLEEVSKKMKHLFNKYGDESGPSGKYEYDLEDDGKPESPRQQLNKMLYFPAETEEEKRWQRENDKLIIVSSLMKVHPTRLNIYRKFREGKTELSKAMAKVTGAGLDWVPEQFSADFIERMEMEFRVAGLIDTIPISNKTGTLKVPAADTAATLYRISGATTEDDIDKIPATTPGTRVVTIEPEKLGARVLLDADLQEDAVIDMAEYIRKELYLAAARGIDDICINGDTATTHQDSDVTASTDHRKTWKGFRILAPSSSKVDSSDTINIATFRKLWSKMSTSTNEYGMPEDLVILVNQLGFLRLMTIAEILTRDKYGDKATIVTGEMASLFNIPVVPTSMIRRNLNASGVYDGNTTTYTELLLVNKRAFLMGTKRQAKVDSEKDIDYDRTKFVITLRQKMVPKYENTEPIVGVLYGLSVNT